MQTFSFHFWFQRLHFYSVAIETVQIFVFFRSVDGQNTGCAKGELGQLPSLGHHGIELLLRRGTLKKDQLGNVRCKVNVCDCNVRARNSHLGVTNIYIRQLFMSSPVSCVCQGAYVEFRGKFYAVTYFLPPLCRFWRSNLTSSDLHGKCL